MTRWRDKLLSCLRTAFICMIVSIASAGVANACGGDDKGGNNQPLCKKIAGVGFDCDKGYAPQGNRCKPCGHAGQPSCEPGRRGPQCFDYLEKIGGTCVARGGNGQDPYSGVGFDCKPGYNVGDNGKCTRCGGRDQVECEALRSGDDCNDGLAKWDNTCRNWGQEGKKAWPKLRPGFRCEKGLGPERVGSNDICNPCGRLNQPMCEVLRTGPQCFNYLGEIDGKCLKRGGEGELRYEGIGFDCKPGFNIDPDEKKRCTACGDLSQVACEVMRTGDRCGVGLEVDGGMCVPENLIIDKLQERFEDVIGDYVSELLDMVLLARNIDNDETAKAEIKVAEANYANKPAGQRGAFSVDADAVPDNNACLGDNFESWSVGVGVAGNVFKGYSGEAGVAMRCADHAFGQDDSALYSSGSLNYSLGGGASAGVTVGMWLDAHNRLSGDSHGYSVDILSAIDTIKAIKGGSEVLLEGLKNAAKVSPEMSIGLWFEREDDDKIGRLLGMTVAVSGGVGMDAGGTYSKATTVQFPD